MADLLQSARLFEVSTRLQTASSCIKKFVKEKEVSPKEQEAFKWAGNFLARVDWNSGIPADTGVVGGLTVSATSARPKFYSSLIKIGPQLQVAGIDSDEKVTTFLAAAYKLLMSGGKDRKDITDQRLALLGELLHLISQSIMVDLSNNMLPRRRTLLTVGEGF